MNAPRAPDRVTDRHPASGFPVRPRVLLAEENAVALDWAVALLRRLDCAVTVARNGLEAVRLAEDGVFDAIVLEVSLPGVDGCEVARCVRALEAARGENAHRAVIVGMTGMADGAKDHDCIDAGMDCMLVKPLSREALGSVLRTVLGAGGEPAVAEEPLPAVFDEQPLDALRATGGGQRLVVRVIDSWLQSTPALVDEMLASLTAGDRKAVEQIAHTLKSSSAQVGALRLSAQAAAIERLARRTQPEAQRLAALAEGFAVVAPLLRKAAAQHVAAGPEIRVLRDEQTEVEERAKVPRVLIVDDDVVLRRAIGEVLSAAHMDVTAVGSGAQALAALEEAGPRGFDLVTLDLSMPELDGFEVCRRLRRLPGGDMLPVLVMTGHDDAGSVEMAYDAGATDFVSKPLQWSVLVHRIRFLIRGGSAVRSLWQSEARNRAILEAVPDTLLALSRTGRFRAFKPAVDAPMDPSGDYLGRRLEDVLPQQVADAASAAIGRAIESRGVSSFECQLPGENGPRDYEARIAAAAGGEVIALVRDVTGRKRHAERVERLAFYDALTGLPNRVAFEERLTGAIDLAAKDDTARIAILFVDLDRFKAVNDSLGHKAGDELLRLASERLDQAMRATDGPGREPAPDSMLARWAGDEFTVLLPGGAEPAAAARLARRALDRFRHPFVVEGREIFVGVSVGIAVYPDDGADAATLIRHADTAMYTAKAEGRNTFRHYSRTMSEAAMRRIDLEAQLRRALQSGELELNYQPKLALASGHVSGAEALVRWNHPTRGLIPPSVFIPVAEDGGLMIEIGEWVLRTACNEAAVWRATGAGDIAVAVNVSARQVSDPAFLEIVRKVLSDTGLPAALLELELTETVLFQDDDATLQCLHDLSALGVRIAIDDFGTGYSSLSYLLKFPLDTLKIDRTFVSRATGTPDSLAIVKAIIAMGHSLDLEVVAEGVETDAHVSLMRSLRCDVGQGYAIARPLTASAMRAFLDRQIEGTAYVTGRMEVADVSRVTSDGAETSEAS